LIHAVTCEFRGSEIVQCRGFANSTPAAEALTIAKGWATESGLSWAADFPSTCGMGQVAQDGAGVLNLDVIVTGASVNPTAGYFTN
jgi:hypothetical protein